MRQILWVARQEFVLALRSRWTQIFAPMFAVLALAVAWSGYVLSGGHGVQDFARTAASLLQLVLLLAPLMALVGGVHALLPEPGAAELLYSQPLARRSILLGKMLGLWAALIAAQTIGFGAAGAVVFSQSGPEGVAGFLLLGAGLASRLLIVSVLINPVDAVRTGALLGAEGTTAFGAASLAFLRFTGGPVGAGLLLAGSLIVWVVLPPLAAFRRVRRADF